MRKQVIDLLAARSEGHEGINLDCVDSTDLAAFYLDISEDFQAIAIALFPSRPKGYKSATTWLGVYAEYKTKAIRCRLDGNIEGAQSHEGFCENIYNHRLPDFAKW